MLGGLLGTFEAAMMTAPVAITLTVAARRNPHPKGSPEAGQLRLARVGLALAAWGMFGGVVGWPFALAGLIIGVVLLVRGRIGYGLAVLLIAIAAPIIGTVAAMYHVSG